MNNEIFLKERPYRFEPVFKNYEWGSFTSIQRITGKKELSGIQVAEMWMGSHPNGDCSVYVDERKAVKLSDLIKNYCDSVMGKDFCRIFGKQLPFLFKIIAADKPLSIQVHPSIQQAEKGFLKEESAGIELTGRERNFRDKNHKPELIYALTDFYMLKGFRKTEKIIENINAFSHSFSNFAESVSPEIAEGADDAASGAADHANDSVYLKKKLFAHILTAEKEYLAAVTDEVIKSAKKRKCLISEMIIKFHDIYGDDPGIISPLFMNIYKLEPGQAVFIPAGEIHAYVSGTGFEIMANSDNVIRGGLTPKHIDPEVLLDITNFKSSGPALVDPLKTENENTYLTPAEEFVFSVINLEKGLYRKKDTGKSLEMFFCYSGTAKVVLCSDKLLPSSVKLFIFRKGDCFMIPSSVSCYEIAGDSILYRAAVRK